MARLQYKFGKPLIRRKLNGFTLVELLVTIALITVLISLLLPAVRRTRQAALRAQTETELREIWFAIASFANDNNDVDGDDLPDYGTIPNSLTQLIEARRPGPDSAPGNERYLDEESANRISHIGGNQYTMEISQDVKVKLTYHHPPIVEKYPPSECASYNPAKSYWDAFKRIYLVPLVGRHHCNSILVLISAQIEGRDDGEVHLYMDGNAFFVHFSDDGSASLASPEHMYVSTAVNPSVAVDLSPAEIDARLNQVQLDGMLLILELLKDNGKTDTQFLRDLKRDAADRSVVAQAAALLDCDSDGVIRCDDLHEAAYGDKLPDTPDFVKVKTFLRDSLELLELDPCPDPQDQNGIPVEFLTGKGFLIDDAMTYDRACELTMTFCDKPGVAKALCAKLAVARGAFRMHRNLKARDNALRAYRNLVRAQIGKSLSNKDAETLISLSYILQTQTE